MEMDVRTRTGTSAGNQASCFILNLFRQVNKIENRLQIRGHITGAGRGVLFQLKYAKKDSLKIIKKMYYSDAVVHLSRKKEKINKMLEIAGITAE